MDDDFKNIHQYVQTRQPATYQDFISFIQPYMTPRQKDKVRKLLEFHFTSTGQHRLSKKRLDILEKVVHEQARKLLGDKQ